METDKPPRTHRSGQIQPHFFGRHGGTLAHVSGSGTNNEAIVPTAQP
jgi:hypothetical protein